MLKVTICSPEQCFLEGEVTHLSLPGLSGGFEIHPNHYDIVSLLATGCVVAHQKDAQPTVLYIEAGLVECQNNTVSILIDAAHNARTAEQEKLLAKQRQYRRDLQNQEKVNYHELLKSLHRLSAELQTIEKSRQYRNRH
ncbi:ATP synthase F1 subunit epsilon [Candidatus Synchoanobacter obligatus]|uniref:ATP synthase epsilon chain n=1 Tax=Candidatus Synchoanobacter obligatus TaxID=2919597 RepID=A0ABT1L5P0_9GAMM|nr:ATP synthase F1 subunit epsilon [Candidatus Synchoanobacter obligatus]MCP8352188.1 ATP synthase F1 subunit epsilon [Candidatus Synchoanobacter obligatus]